MSRRKDGVPEQACWPRETALKIARVEEASMRWKVERGGPCSRHWEKMHRRVIKAIQHLENGRDMKALREVTSMARSFKGANKCERKNGRDF